MRIMFILRQQPPETITLFRSQSFITADKILISIHRIAMIIWIVKIIRIADIIFTKQIRLVNMIPAILIFLIVHIIIAIRWMLIKILSAVINDWEQIKVIVPSGCYLDIIIIRKNEQKSRCCGTFDVRIFAG